MAVRGVRFAISAGGLLCVLGVSVTGALMPAFRRYDSRTDAFAQAERERRAGAAAAAFIPSSETTT
jgi:hypothetical protein